MNPDSPGHYWHDSVPPKTQQPPNRKEKAAADFKQKISNIDVDKDVLSVMSEVVLAFNQLAADCDYDQGVIRDCRNFVEDMFTLKFNFF